LQQKEAKSSERWYCFTLPQRTLFVFVHDFVIFDDRELNKFQDHNQYFANIAARKSILEKNGGIIWNTQGSGKSLIMVWLTKWIIENVADSRVVIITDREELDDQIESLFIDVNEKVRRAKSCKDLRDILDKSEDPIICSLIHKYGHNAGKQADIDQYRKELLKDLPKDFKAKGNIIAFIDECHRTNSGKLHEAVKTLMPDAVLIGFTGTPLLKTDKKTSLEIFGPYIHTYKFDEGVEDGVILDLRYEARDVDQDLSSQDKVDLWFEQKTKGLTERAKLQLKQSWTSINKLYSSKQRLEKIAADIVFDMSLKPRLREDRGTAMLVANSIYEACRYWEIFMSMGFTKCAVVTSYEPTTESVRTATSDPSQESEEEYKKSIYERMLGGKRLSEYEKEVKKQFKENPAANEVFLLWLINYLRVLMPQVPLIFILINPCVTMTFFRLFVVSIDQMAKIRTMVILLIIWICSVIYSLLFLIIRQRHSMGLTKKMSKGLSKTAMMKQSQKWKVRFHHWKPYLRMFQNRKLILISLNFSAETTAMTMKKQLVEIHCIR
jgi:type I restriction enzyme R subunit